MIVRVLDRAVLDTQELSVHLGLYLPQLILDFDQILDRVVAAEQAGFHSVWFMDHLAAPGRPEADTLEAWTLLSAVSARTQRLRLGHLVGCSWFRHPAVLAKMAVTVDAISGGRLELGLGWGSVPEELQRFGFGSPAPGARARQLRETLEALDLLFTGEDVSYEGEHVRLDGAICRPVPVQDRIPIHLGGAGRQLTMPMVAEYADWWNCPAYAVDDLEELAALAGGARISVQRPVGLVTDERDRDDVEGTARRRFGGWGGLLVGDASEIAQGLRRDRDLGAELAIIQFSDFGHPDTIEALAESVAPLV